MTTISLTSLAIIAALLVFGVPAAVRSEGRRKIRDQQLDDLAESNRAIEQCGDVGIIHASGSKR